MADQVYVTHCVQTDSVNGQVGFGVRAASTTDPELVKFAADYSAYELPLEMYANDPSPAQSPVRLAMVAGPRNTVALIHSAYVGQDTMGRQGNFFSHLIFYPRLTAIQALESWGAGEWRTSYPKGADKRLDPLSDQPFKGGVITQDALTEFLSGTGVGGGQDLATRICPPGLRNTPERCQELLMKALDACLMAGNGTSAAARARFYLVAEPGLVALLLYGVARLLPPDASANLTFSTFENAQRSLRQSRLAFACGTYISDPQKSLDADYFRTQGYGFDAAALERCSPELAGDPSPFAKAVVRLAVDGKWDKINQIHDCHPASLVSADSLLTAIRMNNHLVRAKEKRLTLEDLLAIHKTSEGKALVQKHQAIFWPLVIYFSNTSEEACREFAELIRKHANELTARSGLLLAAQKPEWRSDWNLFKAVEESKPKLVTAWLSLLQSATRAAPEMPFLPRERVALLQESHQIGVPTDKIPDPIPELLLVSSAHEFAQLQKAGLPAEWLAVSLEFGLSSAPPAAWAIEAIHAGSDKLLQAVTARFKNADWHRYCRFLNKKLLLEDAGPQYALFKKLAIAREQCKPNTPTDSAKIIDDWSLLLGLFKNPKASAASREQIDAACERRLLGSADKLLEEFFLTVVQRKPLEHPQLAVFTLTFDRFHPASDELPQQKKRFKSWLEIVNEVKDPEKGADLKLYFLEKHVPHKYWGDIANKFLPARERDFIVNKFSQLEAQALAASTQSISTTTTADAADDNDEPERTPMQKFLDRGLGALVGAVLAVLLVIVTAMATGNMPPSGAEAKENARLREAFPKLEAEKTKLETSISELKKDFEKLDLDLKDQMGKLKEASKKQIDSLTTVETNIAGKLKKANDDYTKAAGALRMLNEKYTELNTAHDSLRKKTTELEKEQPLGLSIRKVFEKPEEEHLVESFSKASLVKIALVQKSNKFELKAEKDETTPPTYLLGHSKFKKLLTITLTPTTDGKGTDLIMKAVDPKLLSTIADSAMTQLEDDVVLIITDEKGTERRYCWFKKTDKK